MRIKQSGFTIVELLIVIVVIGILAALVLNTVSGVQDRSRATTIVNGLKGAEKGLRAKGIDDGLNTWWGENDLTSFTGNPLLSLAITETSLKDYFQEVPSVNGMPNLEWRYDNDGDAGTANCSTTAFGANIIIRLVNNQKVATEVDKQIDDGNLTCGRMKYINAGGGNNEIRYNLSPNQVFE